MALLATTSTGAETLCGEQADVAIDTVVVVGLSTGDTLVARFAGCEDALAILDHDILGRVSLGPDAIAEVVAGKPGEDLVVDVRVSTDAEAAAESAPPETPPAADPVTEEKKLWESQAEFGLNGSEGNSERLSVRLGARTKRSAERNVLTLEALYTRSDEATDGDDRETTENKAFGKVNNDWLFADSAWRYFLAGTGEYDEFQDYDARLSASMGPAYAFIDNDTTSLIGRAGIGTSWKIGGEDDDPIFELVFGYDFEHAFTERSKLVSSARIFPNMSDTGEFRTTAQVAYDQKLDTPLSLTLRLGVEDRYDSTIEDTFMDDGMGGLVLDEEFKKNDLDYFVTLIWDF